MTSRPLNQRHNMAGNTEHYLRAILELRVERGYARVVDIAARVGLTKGSVSLALAQLAEKELVTFDAARFPMLTAAGRRVAAEVRGRHHIVRSFLVDLLGLSAGRADAEACRWEHVTSHDAADRLLDPIRFCGESPTHRELLEEFRSFHREGAPDWPGAPEPGRT